MKNAVLKLGTGEIQITDKTLEKIQAKADQGLLLAEFGAPRLVEGACSAEKSDRYRMVLPDRVCAKITDVYRGFDGNVYGTVTPFGPIANIVKQAIQRGIAEKLGFSVRAVACASTIEVITYDLTRF